jgi:hypothetical protein
MLVLLMKWKYKVYLKMDSGGMIYVASFVKIDKGLERVLKFILSHFKAVMLTLLFEGT